MSYSQYAPPNTIHVQLPVYISLSHSHPPLHSRNSHSHTLSHLSGMHFFHLYDTLNISPPSIPISSHIYTICNVIILLLSFIFHFYYSHFVTLVFSFFVVGFYLLSFLLLFLCVLTMSVILL